MRSKKISDLIGRIDLEYIIEALEAENNIKESNTSRKAVRFWQVHRLAACVCIAFLVMMLSFTAVFAASESFRNMIIKVLFPVYSQGELKEIAEGHMTGSFDEVDTLLTFLSRFNAEKMEEGISAKCDSGYSYILLNGSEKSEKSPDVLLAVAESSTPDYRILVRMEKREYEETTGIWQIVSYQIITSQKADKMLKEMPRHIPKE